MPGYPRYSGGSINPLIPFVMTTMEIILSCVGLIICAVIFALVGIVIFGIVWWIFRTDMDIEIDSSEWEENNESRK